jgi:phosphohistidine phosphatase SixA
MVVTFTALIVATQMAASPAPPELRREELMAALRQGGYTLLVRHARTDRAIPNQETPGYTPQLRADQRNLTADGERDVRLMAAVVSKHALPIGEVVSSPMYRCRETADAFGAHSTTMVLRAFPTTAETAALVAAAPRPGTNRVLVTHHFVIETHVPGIQPGDIGESEVAVVRPTGDGKVELVGRITLADWEDLAGAASGVASAQTPGHGAGATVLRRAGATTIAVQVTPATVASIPATRAGTLARRYIEVFNSGDAARMRAFTDSSLVPIADRPTEARVEGYTRLFEQHGPLTVTGVGAVTEDGLTVQVSSKLGNVYLRVVAAPAPTERLQSVSFGVVSGGGHR